MSDLMELVRSEGDSSGKIALDVLRHGKHESLTITPEAASRACRRCGVGF